jgi:hypothetical protein
VEHVAREELAQRIEQIPGRRAPEHHSQRAQHRVENVAPSTSHRCGGTSWQVVGPLRTSVAIARRERNPLRLEQMAQHNLGVALLVRELAMKFKHPHEFSVGAVAHNVGKWVMAFQYPALFGLALTLAKGDPEEHRKVEIQLFGIGHKELGSAFLEHHKINESAASVARHLNNPVNAPAGNPQIVTAMVNLANLLAKAKRVGFSGTHQSVEKQDFVTSPAWEALKIAQVKIPLEPTEYLSALGLVVERVRRQVDLLFD